MSQSSVAACNAAIDARNALLNSGSLEIRSGAGADIDSAPTGSVLVTFALPATAFASASARSATANAITAVTASAGGTGAPYHYIARDSGSNVVAKGSAGTSGTDLILSAATWTSGDDVSVTSWAISMSKGT